MDRKEKRVKEEDPTAEGLFDERLGPVPFDLARVMIRENRRSLESILGGYDKGKAENFPIIKNKYSTLINEHFSLRNVRYHERGKIDGMKAYQDTHAISNCSKTKIRMMHVKRRSELKGRPKRKGKEKRTRKLTWTGL